MPSLDKRFARSEGVSWRVIEQEAVLINPEEAEVMRLNPVGTEIWQRLDGKRTVNELIEHLHQFFDVEKEQLQRDVLRFLTQLTRREMIEEMQGNGSVPG